MKKVLTFTLLILFTFSLCPSRVSAQEASSSSDLQQKINEIKQEIASKAAQIKDRVNQSINNKVYAGAVVSKDLHQIIIASSLNQQQTIITNDYTDFEYGKGLKQSISSGDFVVGLGDVDDKGNLVAKKVAKQTPPSDNLMIGWGKVQSSSPSAVLIEDQNRKNFTIKVDKNTSFQFGNDQGNIQEAEVNRSVVFSGTINQDNSIQGRFIYIFKQGFVDLFRAKMATQSGTKPASTSAKHF